MLREIFKKVKFWKNADRLGPDIPYTHWRLYFKSTMISLCKKKFKYFDDTAEFRPGAYAIVCSKIRIGRRAVIRPNTMLFADPRENGAEIIIDDNVSIGSGVQMYVDNHRFNDTAIPIINRGYCMSKKIVLKRGCWVGANVIILPGVTIGENAVVGAGSVVTKSIPDKVVAVGNPARIIRYL